MVTVSSHLRLGNYCGRFPSDFLAINPNNFLSSAIPAIYPAHLTHTDFTTLIPLGADHEV
jgi:hypothetical protein